MATAEAQAKLGSSRDIPGRLREYETIYILKPETSNDGIAEINNRVRKIIEEQGGLLLKVDNWGKRKLAYEIKKQLKGIYLYWSYLGTPALVTELERNLRYMETVIRYYTIKVQENVEPQARPSEVTDESFAKAATPGPDEEEIVTGQAALRRFGEDDEEGFGFDDDEFGAGDDDAPPFRGRED